MFSELNPTGGKYTYKPTADDLFYSLSEFYNAVDYDNHGGTFQLHGVFFFDTQYGESCAMILDECYVYAPKNWVDTFRAIDGDIDKSAALANGKCAIELSKYKAHGKHCTGIKLVDVVDNNQVSRNYLGIVTTNT